MKSRVLRTGSWLLRLDKGEELIGSLTDFAEKEKFGFACVSGIGAASRATLAVFDTKKKKYTERDFKGDLEIVSLSGNITRLETRNGKPRAHLHCCIAGRDNSAFAGHLVSAEISVTCEIVIRAYKVKVERKKDEETGLMLID